MLLPCSHGSSKLSLQCCGTHVVFFVVVWGWGGGGGVIEEFNGSPTELTLLSVGGQVLF